MKFSRAGNQINNDDVLQLMSIHVQTIQILHHLAELI